MDKTRLAAKQYKDQLKKDKKETKLENKNRQSEESSKSIIISYKKQN